MNPTTFKFHVWGPAEPDAGYTGFNDEIKVTVQSGNLAGREKEFLKALEKFLSDFYDSQAVCMEFRPERLTPPEQSTQFMAFWKYGLFPYFLAGIITNFRDVPNEKLTNQK
jgi:hypothetical protein